MVIACLPAALPARPPACLPPCMACLPASCAGLDENDYDRGMCEDAFNTFKACRARQRNVKAGVSEKAVLLVSGVLPGIHHQGPEGAVGHKVAVSITSSLVEPAAAAVHGDGLPLSAETCWCGAHSCRLA